jgi:hypothetical protein
MKYVRREQICEGRSGGTYVLNESALVLEGVTLAQVVELVVKVLVDLAGGAVLDQQATENALAAHPDDLAVGRLSVSARVAMVEDGAAIPGHTGVLGTLSLTETTVATEAASGVQLTGAGARVHGDGLADDEAIRDELADGLAGVGVGDLADLVGVEPDLSLTAANNGGGQALLGAKVDPVADACQCLLCWITVCDGFCRPDERWWEEEAKGVCGWRRTTRFFQNWGVDRLSGRRFADTDILTGMEGCCR